MLSSSLDTEAAVEQSRDLDDPAPTYFNVPYASVLWQFCRMCHHQYARTRTPNALTQARVQTCSSIAASDRLSSITLYESRRRTNQYRPECIHPGIWFRGTRPVLTGAHEIHRASNAHPPRDSKLCKCLARLLAACSHHANLACFRRGLCLCEGLCEDFRCQELGCKNGCNGWNPPTLPSPPMSTNTTALLNVTANQVEANDDVYGDVYGSALTQVVHKGAAMSQDSQDAITVVKHSRLDQSLQDKCMG